MKIISLILICFLLLGCDRAEKEIFVLPQGFTGYVLIVYDQPGGQEQVYEDGKRVYNIPTNGILKTKFTNNPGWMEFPEFYYETVNSKQKIPVKFDLKTLPLDSIVAYGGTAGRINKDLAGKERLMTLTYHIGNKAQIDSTYDLVQRLDIIKLIE